jgi:hypothetical protein
VDISGHPPIPLARNIVFHLGNFSIVFRVSKFWGHFEVLNDIFLRPSWNVFVLARNFQ